MKIVGTGHLEPLLDTLPLLAILDVCPNELHPSSGKSVPTLSQTPLPSPPHPMEPMFSVFSCGSPPHPNHHSHPEQHQESLCCVLLQSELQVRTEDSLSPTSWYSSQPKTGTNFSERLTYAYQFCYRYYLT